MRSGRSAGRGGVIPWGLLGMLFLVMVVEGVVARHPLECADYMTCSWQFSAQAARGRGVRAEVICLGDSLVKLGVLPPVMERRLGLSTYNLAVYAGQAPSTFFLLRRALDAGARPRVVVVDFHPNLLAAAPVSTVPYWAELLDARDALEMVWQAPTPGPIFRTALAWLLPTYKGRGEIRAAALSAVRGETDPGLETRRTFLRNWWANGGAHAAEPVCRAHRPVDTNPTQPARWVPRAMHASYVRRFLDLARSQGITVVWLIPPTHPDWQLRRERLEVDEPYTRFIRGMVERYPNLVVVDGRHAGYDERGLLDTTHLNARGAVELTEALADVLGPRLGGATGLPRWVALPPYRGRDPGPPVEDIALSRQAVRSAAARR